jgi:hypothetical protein
VIGAFDPAVMRTVYVPGAMAGPAPLPAHVIMLRNVVALA